MSLFRLRPTVIDIRHLLALCLGLALCACSRPAAGPSAGPAAPTGPTAPANQNAGAAEPSTPAASEPAAEAIAATSVPAAAVPASPAAPPPPPPLPAVDCASGPATGKLALSTEEYESRNGKGVHALDQLDSSLVRPVEICGVPAQHQFLLASTCADGSRPFATVRDVLRARVASMDTGGRCGKIIDRYAVKCPERTHDIYMDAYFCPAVLPPLASDGD